MPRNPRYDLLYKTLIEARLSYPKTQEEIALRLGKPQSYVSKYESGERRLDVIEFLDVCEALEVQPTSILNLIRNKDGN